MIAWILRHPAFASIIGTWVFNNIITVLVSSLPAPTKDSKPSYVYWFKVANTIIGNVARANSTALEKSPNWEAAVNAHIAKLAATGQIGSVNLNSAIQEIKS
jgi:hypothetical protein